MANNKNGNDEKLSIVRNIDDIVRISGRGTRSAANRDLTYGLNLSGQSQQLVIPNRQTTGMVFFTRPLLNLTYGNLSKNRRFFPWRDCAPNSTLGISRAYLDPWSNYSRFATKNANGTYMEKDLHTFASPLVDSNSAFINILTNNLMSLSGWPDMRGDAFVSDRGIRNEQWFMYDGIAEINEVFDIDATFRNTEGDTTLLIFLLWQMYMSELRNSIDPYPEFIAWRRLDYNTRIYDFVLDSNRQYIVHWAATGASAPMNTPFGEIFDYDYSSTVNPGIDQLNISFKSAYADYNDIITLYEFNRVVGKFNPSLRLYNEYGVSNGNFKNITDDLIDNIPFANKGNNSTANAPYVKLLPNEKLKANYRAYPLINLYTKEMEWWVRREDFMKYVIDTNFKNEDLNNPSEQLTRDVRDYYNDTRKR